MLRLFRAWQRHADAAAIAAGSTPGAWLLLAAIALVMMGIAGAAPGARDYFGLRLGPALAAAAPPFLLGPVIGALFRRGRLSQPAFGALILANATLLKFFTGSLMAFSSAEGAALMAAPMIFTVSFHGYQSGTTLRNPIDMLLAAMALLAAYALSPGGSHAAVFAVATPAALGGNLLLGVLATRARREREHREDLLAAVRAQILDERSRRVQELSDVLLEIHQNNHDARSALQAATAYADAVAEHGPPPYGADDASDRGLRTALKRLDELLENSRRIAHAQQTDRPEAERTQVLPVVRDVLDSARARFPGVELSSAAFEAVDPAVAVAMCGGEAALHRVLENLVVNACQGDGERQARHVEVAFETAPDVGAARIEVRDDGPGFPARALERPIEGFASGKPEGLGLGLYTAERLVRASGGSIERANGAGGGAVVSVFLELDPRP